uniref:primase-helicase family protein n=1 Tax=Helicobacter pylori TaxID=210 RepID=UPI000EB26EB4
MIDYTAEQLQELEQLKVTEQEIEILKRMSIGTLPPSNLGRDDMLLFQLTAYRDYELYFIKEQRLERLSYNSARNFMSNMGFNKRYFEDLHVLMMKKVFDPDQPKWRLDNNIWLYNEYQKSEYSAIYQFYRDYGKKKGINKNSTKKLKLPPLHRELFNNVFNDELSIEYMAIKVKRLLSGVKKSNTYTILRGIGGSGKSLFLHYLSTLIGLQQSRVANYKDITGSFNGELFRSVIVTIEELPMSLWSCNDLMRALKEYVANERINIRRKFRENETMQNFTNFFITTNYFDLYETMAERRHCEVVSRDVKLLDTPLFAKLNLKKIDFIEALLYEAPLFFKALLEWDCQRFTFNSKFISPTIINYKQVRSGADHRIKMLLEALIDHDYARILSFNDLEMNTLTILTHYDRETKKFRIPLEVAKEHYLLMDNLDFLTDNGIII